MIGLTFLNLIGIFSCTASSSSSCSDTYLGIIMIVLGVVNLVFNIATIIIFHCTLLSHVSRGMGMGGMGALGGLGGFSSSNRTGAMY